MSQTCCVNNCTSKTKFYNHLRFHKVRDHWYHLFSETKGQNIPNQQSKICSLHFSARDYQLIDRLLKPFHKWQLSKDASPKIEEFETPTTADNDPLMSLDFFENDLNTCQTDIKYSTYNNINEDDNESLLSVKEEYLEFSDSAENIEDISDCKSIKSRRCIVKHCTSKTRTNHILRFHKVRENWYYLFKEILGQRTPNRYSKICSLHFAVEDYLLRDRLLKPFYKWQLAENAVPNISKNSLKHNNDSPMICLDLLQNNFTNYQEKIKHSAINKWKIDDHQNLYNWRGCCVNHCSSTFKDNSKLRFHKVRKNWFKLFSEIKEQQIPNSNSRICSLHFNISDYELRDRLRNPFHKWKLSEEAIPKLTEISKLPLRLIDNQMMCLDFFENDLMNYQDEIKKTTFKKKDDSQNNVNLPLNNLNQRWRGCCVNHCESNARNNQFLRFHTIRENWYHLFMDIKGQKMPKRHSRICSLHFTVDDYEMEDRLLKPFHKWKLSKNVAPKNIRKTTAANKNSPSMLCLNFDATELNSYASNLKQSTIVNNEYIDNQDGKHPFEFYGIPNNMAKSSSEVLSTIIESDSETVNIDFNNMENNPDNYMEELSKSATKSIVENKLDNKKNIIGCALYTCPNSKLICEEKGLNIIFYKFPLKESLKKLWKDFCFFNRYINTENLYLCSEHFTIDSFEYENVLKLNAIPNIRTIQEKENSYEKHVPDRFDKIINLEFDDLLKDNNMVTENIIESNSIEGNINTEESIKSDIFNSNIFYDNHVEESSDDNIEDLFEFTVEPKIYKCIKVDDGYQCEVCNKVLQTLNSYIQHSLCHADRSLLCSICGKILPSYRKLVQHEIKCRRNENDIRQLDTHQKTQSRNIKGFKKLNEENNIKTLVKIRRSKGPFICDICKKNFTNRKGLSSHKKIHLEKKYKCDECKQKCISQSKLQYHKLIHHIYDVRCYHCDKLFSRMQYYKHMHHMNRQQRKCSNCKSTFANDFVYNEHIEKCKITIDSTKSFYCIFCELKPIENINEHIISPGHINMEKVWKNQFYNDENCTGIDFICNECDDISFSDFSLYVYHHEIKHKKNRKVFVKEFFKLT